MKKKRVKRIIIHLIKISVSFLYKSYELIFSKKLLLSINIIFKQKIKIKKQVNE